MSPAQSEIMCDALLPAIRQSSRYFADVAAPELVLGRWVGPECLQTCRSIVIWDDAMLSLNVFPHSCGWVMAHCADIM